MTILGSVGVLASMLVTAPVNEAPAPCRALPVVQQTARLEAGQALHDGLTVASLNIAARLHIGDAVAAWTRERDVDVLLLQEVGHDGAGAEAFLSLLSRRLDFHFAYAPAHSPGHDAPALGLAILSRYPITDVRVHILPHHRLRFRSRCRIALGATVIARDGPIGVLNVHLDTRLNSKSRVAQLAPLMDARHEIAIPQIVGGDFNTMNVRWIGSMWPLPYLQRQSRAVRAMLAEIGFGTPFGVGPATFRFLGIPLRLDWLYLKELEALEWGVDKVPITDHRGVWIRVGRPPDRPSTPIPAS